MKGILLLCFFKATFASNGFKSFKSPKSFEKTNSIVKNFIQEKGLKLFLVVDHSQNAKNAGLELKPNRLYIFGNPKAGTPLMKEQASMGLDLPVKLQVFINKKDEVYVGFNNPLFLAQRHGISKQHKGLKKMKMVLSLIESEIKR